MTKSPIHWGAEEYCAFYASTSCTQSGVEEYSCSPECLTDCPDVFCDTFSSLVYCGDTVDQAGKTSIENMCMSSVSSQSNTKTVMNMTSILGFENVDKDTFDTDALAQEAAISTMSNMVSGIPANRIRITDVLDLESRRRLLRLANEFDGVEQRSLAVVGTSVHYRITAVLEELGFDSSQSQECFNSLSNQIDQSIAYGQFEATLITTAHHLGSTTMNNVAVQEETEQFVESVTMEITVEPTSMPSPVPIPSDDDLSEGDIIAIAIMVPFAVICISAGLYWWFFLRVKDDAGIDKKSILGPVHGDSSASAKFDEL